MKPRKITVWWVDSASPERYWNYPDGLETWPHRIVTCGYLLRENKRVVVVASSLGPHAVGGALTIPKRAITKRRNK